MNLFIDTNIFLSFFHYSNDDLEELRKLSKLLEDKEITLYLTEQVKHEFYRNREVKINDALQTLSKTKISDSFPHFCKEYDSYNRLRSLITDYEKEKRELINRMKKDIAGEKLKADSIIKKLFELGHLIDSNQYYDQAVRRLNLGDPPGKKGSCGDAINWISLLNKLPEDQDLYFITGDKDYRSAIDEKSFNPYLFVEWKRKKGSELIFYDRLSKFFIEKFPKIKLADEYEKYKCIQALIDSGSFQQTHNAIAHLSAYISFTSDEVTRLVEAAVANEQIRWIARDEDVNKFFCRIFEEKGKDLTGKLQSAFRDMFMPSQSIDVDYDHDLPF